MSTPKKANVATAISKFSDLDLSCQHITTSNFMEFGVAKALPIVPRQSVNIDMTTFTRLAPMALPTFGNADIHNRAYFVPFRTIMRGWNEFITDTPYVDGDGNSMIINKAPMIYNSTFCSVLRGSHFSTVVTTPSDDDEYDYIYVSGGATKYYRFTTRGKRVYKLLCSLGYRIYLPDNSPTLKHSALPLLSLMKIYFDWYFPSVYVDDVRAQNLRRWFNYDKFATTSFEDAFTSNVFREVAMEIERVCYDSDYFVSAWDNPNAPTSGSYSDITVNDPTSNGALSVMSDVNNGTPFVGGNITKYALDALRSVSDYLKRHQIAGARVIDRYLTRFGVQLSSEKTNRSMLIGESNSKLQFGDVTSTADTSGASLGAYAGKGFGLNENKNLVSFSTDEYGLIIIVSTIVPKTAYYQGADRHTFYSSRFDFFTPEFDNLGVQALSTRELFMPVDQLNGTDKTNGINFDNAVFGFVPRYAEYKRGYDNMTGDLVLRSKNKGQTGWTLMRDVSGYYNESDLVGELAPTYDRLVHSQSFVDGDDVGQYNRIFNVTDDVEDKFYVIHNFVIKSRFPGRQLYDTYEFKDDDKTQHVSVDVNGVRQN